jgi:methyl-accepting chemotaxis protein
VGRRINLAIGIGFALVLVVGGISVLLAWAISTGVVQGRQKGIEAEAIDRIHSIAYHFVGDLHLALRGGRIAGHHPPEQLLDDLKREIAAYETLEHAQEGHESREELGRLDRLKSLLTRLEAASLKAMAAAALSRPPDPGELALLNGLAHEMSDVIGELHVLHRKKFQRAADSGQQGMLLISALYVAFAVCGGLLLLLGNRFLSRALVLPITRLAQAALQIARGELAQRVPVRSGDEVGQPRAFNLMAERLESPRPSG